MSAGRNQSIQAIRALAAFMVFLSHSLMMINNDSIQYLSNTPLHFFFDGQCAVVFFMTLSGFFYYKAEEWTLKRYARGILKKVVKIYPSHIIMIVLGVVLCNLHLSYNSELFTDWSNSFWTTDIGFAEAIKQMLIVFPGTDSYLVNSPVWYLVVEVRMFLLMPLLAGMLYFVRERMGVLFYYCGWTLLIFAGFVVYPFALCYLIGYMTANVLNTCRLTEKKAPETVLLGGVFLSLLAINMRNEVMIENKEINFLIQSSGAAILILCCYMNKDWLGRTILTKLGDYSYEFYIAHFVVLLSCKPMVTNTTVFWCLALVLSLVLTFVLHWLQNRLFNQLLK